jgi:hypothetical protein
MNKIHQGLSITVASVVLSFAAFTDITQPSNAATLQAAVLDQELVIPQGLGAIINGGFTFVGQTYTAGLTGTLAGVNVDVFAFNPTFPLRVAIHEVSAGVPTSTVLGETVLASASATLNDLISFSGIIPQVSGRQYAIVVNYLGAPPPGDALGDWLGGARDEYLGGQVVFSNDTTTWTTYEDGDLHFRTFVLSQETVTVPESSSVLGLLAFGALGVVSSLKRKQRQLSLEPADCVDPTTLAHVPSDLK